MVEWWLAPLRALFVIRPQWRWPVGRALLKIGARFYWALAVLFILVGAWDQFVRPIYPELKTASFDWLMSHRIQNYRPDPQIVLLDIDERSLAAQADSFGRWPWPRDVLAKMSERIENAGAEAVVFDILLADPDISNPNADLAFDDYVARSKITFFAAVRLDPRNDPTSAVTVEQLHFATPEAAPHAGVRAPRTIALIPPRFKAIYDSTRTGMINVYPDSDDVLRWYLNYESLGGYRVPSLPYRMGQVLHWPVPEAHRTLMNWPRGVVPYERISFSDAWHAAQQGADTHYFDRFAHKIVLIGATAPGLNDLKSTPINRLHPGLAVLATAIDNTKNGRFITVLAHFWIWVIAIGLLVLALLIFVRTDRSMYFAKYGAVVIPVTLLAISMISVSASDLLLDLSVPAALALAYIGFAAVFEQTHRDFVTGAGVFAPFPNEVADGRIQVACLPRDCSIDAIRSWMRRPGCDFKLWLPPRFGLGATWGGQGWVLWRLRRRGDESDSATAPHVLRWQDVPDGEAFALAQAIVRAAQVLSSAPSLERPT
jgi:adenylate cyclase